MECGEGSPEQAQYGRKEGGVEARTVYSHICTHSGDKRLHQNSTDRRTREADFLVFRRPGLRTDFSAEQLWEGSSFFSTSFLASCRLFLVIGMVEKAANLGAGNVRMAEAAGFEPTTQTVRPEEP